MDDLTGRQFGPYRIIAPLGEGGMAAVYKAYQANVERHVALKVLPQHLAKDPQFVARFRQEAKILANLQHPHIVPVHDYGEAEGYTYIVMPLMKGGALASLLHGRPLPLEHIRRIMSQIGEALDYAHERGLIHRDVKPSNVLMDERGNCSLTDFGLTKMLEGPAHFTSTGAILGTPAYMSPEQARGEAVDHRSDLYSLGVLLFELATGQVPFQGGSPMAIIFKHIQDAPPAPRTLNPELPETVECAILKAMAKNPGERYASAGEMVKALQPPVLVSAEKTLSPARAQALPQPAPPQPDAQAVKAQPPLWRRYWVPAVAALTVIVAAVWLGSGLGHGTAPQATPGQTMQAALALTSTPEATVTETPAPRVLAIGPANIDQMVLLRVLTGHVGEVRDVTFSPDGATLASASADGTVRMWQAGQGTLLHTLGGHQDGASAVAFSPDGTSLASGSLDGAIRLWEVSDGTLLGAVPAQIGSVWAVTFLPEGAILASGSVDGTVRLWRASDGTLLQSFVGHTGIIQAVALSPDGTILASASADKTVRLWRVSDGTLLGKLQGHRDTVQAVAFSADGTMLASASLDKSVRLWRVSDGAMLGAFESPTSIPWSLAFSPDGTVLASGASDKMVRLWQVSTGDLLRMLEGHTGLVSTVAFSPDGTMLASGSWDNTVREWGVPP